MVSEKEIEKMCDVFMRPTHYEALDWFQAMNVFRLAYNYGYRLIKPCLNVISRDDLLERALFVPIAPLKIGEETHCEHVVFVDDIQKMPGTMPPPKTEKKGKWIWNNCTGEYECSECGCNPIYEGITPDDSEIDQYRHCRWCGAPMEVEK